MEVSIPQNEVSEEPGNVGEQTWVATSEDGAHITRNGLNHSESGQDFLNPERPQPPAVSGLLEAATPGPAHVDTNAPEQVLESSSLPESKCEPSLVKPELEPEGHKNKDQPTSQSGRGLSPTKSGHNRTFVKKKSSSDRKGSPSSPVPLQTDLNSLETSGEILPRSPDRPRIEYNTLIQVS
eukprot:jgi/Botrbrau1/6496/Bobra.0034s0069.1